MKNLLLILSVIIIASLFIVLIMEYRKIPNTAYVKVEKVYNDFTYKKELENKLGAVKKSRQSILDSLKMGLQLLYSEIEREGGKNKEKLNFFNVRREEYLGKGKEFEQDNLALTEQYDELIFNQLKQYIKDYGTGKGYTYIFGSMDNPNLLYGDETKDITMEVIEFVNQKYSGINNEK